MNTMSLSMYQIARAQPDEGRIVLVLRIAKS